MDRAWLILYNLFVIPVLWGLLRVIAVWNEKVRRGLRGRRYLFSQLHAKLAQRGARRTFWVHVASLGEFEQAKPILERIKVRHPEIFVFVSFFSPSGFDHSQDYSFADAVAYLPFDSYGAAKRFVAVVRPDAALFVRYDLWLNHLRAIRRARVPLFLACTSANSYARANPIVRSYLAAAYRMFDAIFCNDDADRAVFAEILRDPARCLVTGDTRYDRVMERARASRRNPPLPADIVAGRTVLVAGSTWPADEEIVLPAIAAALHKAEEKFLCVIAPHEPDEATCARIESHFPCCRLSHIDGFDGEPVVLVDSVGRLFPLYQHATLAFVGGGFGDGVHSVLEPAAFGVPATFGPGVDRAHEARALLAAGGGAIVETEGELSSLLIGAITAPEATAARGARAAAFVAAHAGASDRILEHFERTGALPAFAAPAARPAATPVAE